MEGLEDCPTNPFAHEASSAMNPTNEDWVRLHALEFAPHRLHSLLDAYGGDPAAVFRDTSSG